MIAWVEGVALTGFQWLEARLNHVLGSDHNPIYQLGALAFLLFWVTVVTGVYLFVFFDTSVSGAYLSVQRLTEEQWWLGGIMRSLHRYASAMMAFTVTLHLLREFALGRFRRARAFSWVSGVPLLWFMFAAAIGGYLLVWDMLAQYIAIVTSEWFDWLPVFGDPLARNFFRPGSLSDRLFSLLVFLHIAIPLFLLVGMLIHIKRLKLARTNPARGLGTATLLALLMVSVIRPATSMEPADLSRMPLTVDLDWVYLNVYPLFDAFGPAALWGLLGGLTVGLVLLPRLSAGPAGEAMANDATDSPAVVDPANCNGCSWCFEDCPYEAITMVRHEYKAGLRQAQVNADLCTACGICAGACPSATPFRHVEDLVSGIEIPGYSLDTLRAQTRRQIEAMPADSKGVLVFGCDHGVGVEQFEKESIGCVSLPCAGLLPPSFVDWAARQPQIASILVTGCHPEGCFQRLGSRWVEQRLAGSRQPHLRTRGARAKVDVAWAGPSERNRLAARLDEICESMPAESADGYRREPSSWPG